jgi:hypothetical protein
MQIRMVCDCAATNSDRIRNGRYLGSLSPDYSKS